MNALISFLIFTSLTVNEPVSQTSNTNSIPVKESIFLTMERTPCFGKCPNYKITIFNTGNVIYEGFNFTEKKGKYTTKLSAKEIEEIESQTDVINLFLLKDKYDAAVTDIPSCILMVNYKGKKKKILDRYGAPQELKQFEKFIDSLVLTKDLKKLDE